MALDPSYVDIKNLIALLDKHISSNAFMYRGEPTLERSSGVCLSINRELRNRCELYILKVAVLNSVSVFT